MNKSCILCSRSFSKIYNIAKIKYLIVKSCSFTVLWYGHQKRVTRSGPICHLWGSEILKVGHIPLQVWTFACWNFLSGRLSICNRKLVKKKQIPFMNLTYVMQHIKNIKRGDFALVKSILSFVFDVLELFLSFKMTPRLSKLIKAFKFYNWKRIENSYCFLYYFLNVFIYI